MEQDQQARHLSHSGKRNACVCFFFSHAVHAMTAPKVVQASILFAYHSKDLNREGSATPKQNTKQHTQKTTQRQNQKPTQTNPPQQLTTLKEGILRGVFKQKAARAWFGCRAEKAQVTMKKQIQPLVRDAAR